jgi:hypothetical protein
MQIPFIFFSTHLLRPSRWARPTLWEPLPYGLVHVCRVFFRNNGSNQLLRNIGIQKFPLLWPTVALQWAGIALVQEWNKTQQWHGSHSCKNDLLSHQCNNDLRDVAWRTPLECQCIPKSTHFKSCLFVCGLIKDAVGSSEASNGRIINSEVIIWVTFPGFAAGIEGNYGRPKSGYPVSWSRFEHGNSRIRSASGIL